MKFPNPPPSTVEVVIKGMVMDPSTNMPVVLLHEEGHPSLLPIWIGMCEANSIAMELEGVRAPRPMTHDLVDNLIRTMGFEVEHMRIHTLEDGVFLASIHLCDQQGNQKVVDSRPSDALAIAIRAKARIFVAESVIQEAGVEEASEEETLKTILERLRPEDMGDYEM